MSNGLALRQPGRKQLIGLLAVLGIVFFLLSLSRPYSDDPLIYSLIGKAIYEKGAMPFTYAFDHKPLLTYYLYGLLAMAVPDEIPKYQIVSILLYGLTAVLTHAFSRKESWLLHFLVITALSIRLLRFSANSELVFCLFAMASILLVVRGRGLTALCCAGFFAAAAFQVNYMAAFSIGPPVLYAIFTAGGPRGQRWRSLAFFALGFAVCTVLVFLPLYLKDPALIAGFFAAQKLFLGGYQGFSGTSILNYMLPALPLLALLVACLPCAAEDRRLRNILVLATVFAFVGTLPPGKFYVHYLYALVPSLAALYALSTGAYKRLALVAVVVVLALLSIRPIYWEFGTPAQIRMNYDLSQYRKLKEMAGNEKLLSIRASPTLPLFTGLEPAQPLVWVNHAEVIYGPGEDDYFVGQLRRRPKFVATLDVLCDGTRQRQSLPKSCDEITAHYSKIMTFPDREWWRRAAVYQLNPT